MNGRLRKIVQEPLVQFLLIGAIVFGIDRLLFLQKDDPRLIIVDEGQLSRLIDIFREGQGRLPEEQEIENLIVKWSQNEIFYREAVAMGLDQGDDMMRSRLILKMRNIIFNRVIEEPATEDSLQQWFELNRASYDLPARYSVEYTSLDEATTKSEAIAALTVSNYPLLDSESTQIRRYQRRSKDNLIRMFGQDAGASLFTATPGQWVAFQRGDQWLGARITETFDAVPADYQAVRSQVARDYKRAASGLQVSEMAEDIARKYHVDIQLSTDDVTEILAASNHAEDDETLTARSRTLKARAGVAQTGGD